MSSSIKVKAISKRKAPIISATNTSLDLGDRRKGSDGKMWKVTETKSGKRRWQRVTPASASPVEAKRGAKFHNIFKNFVENFTNGSENDEGAFVYPHAAEDHANFVKKYLKKHKKDIQDGDIVYVGTGYIGKPKYGFGYMNKNKIELYVIESSGKNALNKVKKMFPKVNYGKIDLNHWALNYKDYTL